MTGITLIITAVLGGRQSSWAIEGLESLSSHESKILMSICLQPHENEFLAGDGYYQVSFFQLTVNNSQDLCPTGNCEYTIEDGEFRTNSLPGITLWKES